MTDKHTPFGIDDTNGHAAFENVAPAVPETRRISESQVRYILNPRPVAGACLECGERSCVDYACLMDEPMHTCPDCHGTGRFHDGVSDCDVGCGSCGATGFKVGRAS